MFERLEEGLLNIASEVLKRDVDLDTKREDISEWDSFAHLMLVARVEEELGLIVPLEEVSNIRCLADFLRYTGRNRDEGSSSV